MSEAIDAAKASGDTFGDGLRAKPTATCAHRRTVLQQRFGWPTGRSGRSLRAEAAGQLSEGAETCRNHLVSTRTQGGRMRISVKLVKFFGRRSVGVVVLGAMLLGPLGSVTPSDASPSHAPSKSAAVAVFVGPPGWRHVQGTSDGLGSWVHPGDSGYSQNIIVEAKNGIGSLDALFRAEVAYIATLPDQFGYAPTDTTVCGNHPAKYMSYTYTSPTGLPITSEVVIAVFGTTGYSARYNKSISQFADAGAERSLTTLCGRATSH